MYQVSTGDGWAPYIARPLVGNESPSASSSSSLSTVSGTLTVAANMTATVALADTGTIPDMNRAVAIFFMVFFFMSGICLLGVVHAILLDEFMVAVQEERQRLKEEEVEMKFITSEKLGSPLDPLLASLAHFHSSIDLSTKIKELFLMIDANGSGSLDYQEICDGLKALEGFPVKLSLEDLDTLTENRALCNADGELDLPAFERLIRHQLQLYVIRTLAAAMERIERQQGGGGCGDEHIGLVLFVLKLMIANMSDFVPAQAKASGSDSIGCPVPGCVPHSGAVFCVGGQSSPRFRSASSAPCPETTAVARLEFQMDQVLAKEGLILDLLQEIANGERVCRGAHSRDNSGDGGLSHSSQAFFSTVTSTYQPIVVEQAPNSTVRDAGTPPIVMRSSSVRPKGAGHAILPEDLPLLSGAALEAVDMTSTTNHPKLERWTEDCELELSEEVNLDEYKELIPDILCTDWSQLTPGAPPAIAVAANLGGKAKESKDNEEPSHWHPKNRELSQVAESQQFVAMPSYTPSYLDIKRGGSGLQSNGQFTTQSPVLSPNCGEEMRTKLGQGLFYCSHEVSIPSSKPTTMLIDSAWKQISTDAYAASAVSDSAYTTENPTPDVDPAEVKMVNSVCRPQDMVARDYATTWLLKAAAARAKPGSSGGRWRFAVRELPQPSLLPPAAAAVALELSVEPQIEAGTLSCRFRSSCSPSPSSHPSLNEENSS